MITVGIEPFPIDDFVPQGEDIAGEFQYLCRHRSGGLSRMQAEHIQGWLDVETQDQDPVPEQ